MVISTFLSAPIMYVSAWLLTIPLMDPVLLVTELQNVSFNISIVCLIALVGLVSTPTLLPLASLCFHGYIYVLQSNGHCQQGYPCVFCPMITPL